MSAGANQTAAGVSPENPWPGLAPFIERDAPYFHGREAEIRALLQLVGREDLVLLYGVSGLGKTSLLRAGLFPKLPAAMLPVYIRLHFAATAQDSGVAALRNQVLLALHEAAEERLVELPGEARSGTLWEYFRRRDQALWGPGNQIVIPLLVFDQFEQLFTRQPDPGLTRQDIDAFLEDLGDLVGGRVPRWLEERLQSPTAVDRYVFESTACKAIVSFREEYLADVKRLRTLVTCTDRNSLRLEPMKQGDAIASVRGAAGHLLTPGAGPAASNDANDVAAAIVAQVADRTLADDEPTVDPAILSVFCTELNRARVERAKSGGSPLIDLPLVAANKSEHVIGTFYRRAVSATPDAVRRFIEERLVLPSSRTRNSVAQEETRHLPAEAINELVDTWRILRHEVVGRQKQVRIELTHDVLVGPVMQDRQRRIQQEVEARARRVQKQVGAAVAAVFVLMLLVFYASARVERARDLAAKAEKIAAERPLDALLLAIAAAESAPVDAAEHALRTASTLTSPRALLHTDFAIVDGDFASADEFVTLDSEGRVNRWNLATGRIAHTQEGHRGAYTLRVMSDGSVVTTAPDIVRVWRPNGQDRTFKIDDGDIYAFDRSSSALWCGVSRLGGPSVLWNLRDGRKVTVEPAAMVQPATIAFDANGRLLLETGLTGSVRLLDATSGSVLSSYASVDPLEHGALSNDGRLAAVTGPVGTLLFAVTPSGLVERGPLIPPIDSDAARGGKKVAFSADGSRVLSVGDGGVLVWDTASLSPTTSVVTPEFGPYFDAAIGANETVALGAALGRAGLRTATALRPFQLHERDVRRVVFAPDGQSVATVGKDGLAAIWAVDDAVNSTASSFRELLARARARVPAGLPESYRDAVLSR